MLWALASRHSRATTWFGELRSPPLPPKACSYRNVVFSPCSMRYSPYKLRALQNPPSPHLSHLLEDDSQPPIPTHSSCVDMVHTCPSGRRGALSGEYTYTRCTTSLVYFKYIYLLSDSAANAALHLTWAWPRVVPHTEWSIQKRYFETPRGCRPRGRRASGRLSYTVVRHKSG
jgi:hypothetical protein